MDLKNIAIIPIQEYNQLRDILTKKLNKKYIVIKNSFDDSEDQIKLFTENEIIKELTNKNNQLINDIHDISKKTCKEFRKWKKLNTPNL